MRNIARAWLACALVGCGGNSLEGSWQGSCDVESDSDGYPNTYDIQSLSIEEDEDGALKGQAEIQPDFSQEPILGFVTATEDDTEVEVVADIGDQNQGFILTLRGTLDDDVVAGPCQAEVKVGTKVTGQATGTGRLERVDTEASDG